MIIEVENLGRKFNRQWIFRNLSFRMETGNSYTFIGPNGSGKSTVLQIIAGILPSTEGTITYQYKKKFISPDNIFRYLSIAAPYLELIEEFTLIESIEFHIRFKKLKNNWSAKDCIDLLELSPSQYKPIKYFSSGMKQRVKLGLALFSDTPIIMLDEPTTNLDAKGVEWYLKNVQQYQENRLLIICSNQPYEYSFCSNVFPIDR